MSVRDIVIYPEPVLTTPSKPVGDVSSEEIQTLIDDMAETMYVGDGIGLAAPQVGVSLRLMVMDVPGEDEPQGKNLIALINPEIVEREGETTYEEGCLSFPGLAGEVKRAARVKVRALDRGGDLVELEAEGLPAICLQHEIDHLDGVVFIDRMTPLRRRLALKEFRKLREADAGAA